MTGRFLGRSLADRLWRQRDARPLSGQGWFRAAADLHLTAAADQLSTAGDGQVWPTASREDPVCAGGGAEDGDGAGHRMQGVVSGGARVLLSWGRQLAGDRRGQVFLQLLRLSGWHGYEGRWGVVRHDLVVHQYHRVVHQVILTPSSSAHEALDALRERRLPLPTGGAAGAAAAV